MDGKMTFLIKELSFLNNPVLQLTAAVHIFAPMTLVPALMKRIALSMAFAILTLASWGQRTEYPLLGAQVFIEPGQDSVQIDHWFRTLRDSGLSVARIRMFGSHILSKGGGPADYSLYDTAFAAADKYGIKVFATLFPPTDELDDVGGFKFPSDRRQLDEVAAYIDAVVDHFNDAPALYAWVLQNEPGLGAAKVPKTPLSQEMRAQWDGMRSGNARNGFLQADFSDQQFLSWYLDWYLGWIAARVRERDRVHPFHINPHQILETLPEYDFPAFRKYLSSLGASMHMSWHFGYFGREEYPLGVSIMSDIIRSGAGEMPFWITELQGGNVTASGNRILCPTAEEISQWLWTGIGAGAEGIIFWTLNQRAAVSEAGEWGLLTFQGRPSNRLEAAASVAAALKEHAPVFSRAVPLASNITILYNKESLWIQRRNADIQKDTGNDGRSKGAVMMSLSAAYDAVSAWGVVPAVSDMDAFDWSDAEGKTVILPHTIAIPSSHYDHIREFVRNGGTLVMTGLAGYYDETMRCRFMGGFPLADVFGADISEFKAVAPYFPLPSYKGIRLQAHLWKGLLCPEDAVPLLSDQGETLATSFRFGQGRAVWFPSLVDLGCWHRDEKALEAFYGDLCRTALDCAPLSFRRPRKDVLVRMMDTGDQLISILINKSGKTVRLPFRTGLQNPKLIYDNMPGKGVVSARSARLRNEQCLVVVWDKP